MVLVSCESLVYATILLSIALACLGCRRYCSVFCYYPNPASEVVRGRFYDFHPAVQVLRCYNRPSTLDNVIQSSVYCFG